MNIPNGLTLLIENRKNHTRVLGNVILEAREKESVHFKTTKQLREAIRLATNHEIRIRDKIPKEVQDLLDLPEEEKESEHPDAPGGLFYRDEFVRFNKQIEDRLKEKAAAEKILSLENQLAAALEKVEKVAPIDTLKVLERIQATDERMDVLSGTIVEVNPKKWKGGNVTVFGNRNMGEIYEESRRLNLNTVTIPVLVRALNATDSVPVLDESSWTNTQEIALNMLARGFNVIIEPFPYIAEGTIVETEWNPSNKTTWFTTWQTILVRIATFAQTNGIDGIYIASNLVKVEYMSAQWATVITKVKSVFAGKVFYRTNWWMNASWDASITAAYQQKLANPLFGLVDVIAIAAYFELTDKPNPTKADLMAALYSVPYHGRGQNVFEDIKAFYTKWKKPIYLGELGISPFSQAASQPWSNIKGTQELSSTMQSNWFSAWYEVFGANDWFLGYSIFTISDTTSEYRVSGTPAEKVIQLQDFGGNADRFNEMERKINELYAERNL